MIPSVLKKPGLLFLSLAAMLFVTIASAAPANAATLAEDSEKFLRFRAIAGCLAKNDLENTSPTDVINGNWFSEGFASTNNSKLSAALLIGGDDNDAACKDGETEDFLVDSAPILGFSDTGAMWCSIQTNANRDKEAASGGNAFTRCTEGSGDYDVSDDDGPEQAAQFTTGVKNYAQGGATFPFEATGAMRYYIYYNTFMEHCDATREKDYVESTDKTKAQSKDYLVINEVVLDGSGKYDIVQALYQVGQDDKQDHNVEGVWSLPNGNSYNLKCYELADKIAEFDEAYGLYLEAHPDEAVGPGGSNGGDIGGPVCSAGVLGWIICPLAEGLVGIIESVAAILQSMLVYQPLIGGDKTEQGEAIKAIWDLILVIANIGLVIAILIIVFSQATSIGLSNYGIKKLLPRVFAAAILMNLSFYLCAIAVDLSNILGVSVKAIVEAGMDQINVINADNPDVKAGAEIESYFGVGAVALLAAAIAIGTGAIWLLLPILATAAVAIITALLILAARQVIITLLIIVSPLAILAWILPNTDEWFTRWRKLFTIMLLLFPIIMAIFYGSILVSAVILSAGTSTGNGMNNFTVKLLAFMVLIVPLFSLPFIMKTAGGILDRFGVAINNRNKGLIDRSRKYGQDQREFKQNRARTNALDGKRTFNPIKQNFRRKAVKDYKHNLAKGIAEETSQEYIAQRAIDPSTGENFAKKMAGSGDPRFIASVQASAKSTVDKIDKESAQRREILIRAQHDPRELLKASKTGYIESLKSGDDAAARAYQNILLTGGSKGVQTLAAAVSEAENYSEAGQPPRDLFKTTDGKATEVSSVLRSELNSAGLKSKDNALATWAFTEGKLQDRQADAGTYSNLNPVEFVGQSPLNIQNAVKTNAITVTQAQDMLGNEALAPNFGPDKRSIVENWLQTQGITPNKPGQGGAPPSPTGTGGGGTGGGGTGGGSIISGGPGGGLK